MNTEDAEKKSGICCPSGDCADLRPGDDFLTPSGAELEVYITEDGDVIFSWSYPEFEDITGKRYCG